MLSDKVKEVLLVLGLAITLFFGANWIQAHDDAVQLKATLAQQQQVIAAADTQLKSLQAEVAASKAALDQIQQQARVQKARVQTPKQAIEQAPQVLPKLPEPIKIDRTLPDAPVAQIPAADLKPLYDYLVDCKACQESTTEQAKLLAEKDSELQVTQTKLTATEKERDAAVKAAKGGGFWKKTARATKWLAIGFGAGYIVAHAHK